MRLASVTQWLQVELLDGTQNDWGWSKAGAAALSVWIGQHRCPLPVQPWCQCHSGGVHGRMQSWCSIHGDVMVLSQMKHEYLIVFVDVTSMSVWFYVYVF